MLEFSNPTGQKCEGRDSASQQHNLPSVRAGIREEFLAANANPPRAIVC